MWWTPGEEKALQMTTTDGLLLANHEERRGRICKEVSQLSGTSQFNPYPSTRLAQHGHPMALSHLRARFGRASQPAITWVYIDIGSYRIFYQVGGGGTTPQGYRRSSGKLHQRKYNCEVWSAAQDHQRQQHIVCQQRCEENAWVLSSQAPQISTLLSSRERAGRGDKQNSHKDHQQDEPRVCGRMDDAPARCSLGI